MIQTEIEGSLRVQIDKYQVCLRHRGAGPLLCRLPGVHQPL